ncbi:MAG: UDP-N-acetylglucosamine 4-epimerase [Chlamydiae bacterium]|nr:UDP-N-acetylglucosamine 4-epimerase [Chlamydiota bacterium]
MSNSRKRIFITGIAGFIGYHLAKALEKEGHFVMGCDNFNSYYDPKLKKQRATQLPNVHVLDICEREKFEALILENEITHIVHLAAQAGIRYSITHPQEYHDTNLTGFFHLLEILRKSPHIQLTFASSSSVYGLNKKIPFSESDPTDQPANFYGATKKSNELMAHSYHHLYGIPMIGLRFFTVYGPWGRPDMAYFSFTKAILEDKPIRVFNNGNMQRDFTYIDDIVQGIISAIHYNAKFEIFNLGNNQPEELLKMIRLLETYLGKKAILEMLPMQPGEIQTTFADISKAQKLLSFSPKTSLEEGLKKFVEWHSEGVYKFAPSAKI